MRIHCIGNIHISAIWPHTFSWGISKTWKRAPGDRTWKPVPHFAAYERSQEFVKLKWTARISPKPFRWSQPGGWSRSRKGKGMKTQKYCRLLLLFSRLVIYEMEFGARAVILLHPRFRSWWNCGRRCGIRGLLLLVKRAEEGMKGFGRGKGCVFIRQCFVVSNAPSLSTERAVFNEYVMLSWRAMGAWYYKRWGEGA